VTEWIRRLVHAELRNLGEISQEYRGILAPAKELDLSQAGVTGQFLDGAGDYHAAYFDSDYWRYLLVGAFARIDNASPESIRRILDVGSGSGNTTIPLLDICPRACIAACDISPQLLQLLGAELRRRGVEDRVSLLQLDLNQPWFAPDSFDIVIGAAVLHHLFDPAKMLRELFRVVRDRGALVFFEPFELGHKFLELTYRNILDVALQRRGLLPEVAEFLENRIAECQLRTGAEKPWEEYANVDDKWLFTNRYFEKVATELNASALTIYPIHDSKSMLRKQIAFELRCGGGFAPEALPAWAWSLVDRIQGSLSEDLSREIPIEAAVILQK